MTNITIKTGKRIWNLKVTEELANGRLLVETVRKDGRAGKRYLLAQSNMQALDRKGPGGNYSWRITEDSRRRLRLAA